MDFVAAIGGLVEVDVGALRGVFGDETAGLLRDEFGAVIGGVLGRLSKVDAVCALGRYDVEVIDTMTGDPE